MTEAAAATEAKEAKADRPSTASPTPRRRATALPTTTTMIQNPPSLPEPASGTNASGIKASNVQRIVPALKLSALLSSRETVKGGADSERGHPLSNINTFQKQSTVYP